MILGSMTSPSRELTVDRLRVQIFPNRAALGEAAGTAAAGEIARALRERGSARVILASAPSQNELLSTLTEAAIDWSRVTLFHMDE